MENSFVEQKELSPSEKASILRLYSAGVFVPRIAVCFGVTSDEVRFLARSAGICRNKGNDFSPSDFAPLGIDFSDKHEAAIDLFRAGLLVSKISKILKLPLDTVSRWVVKSGERYRNDFRPKDKEKVVSMLLANRTPDEIACALNISLDSVMAVATEQGYQKDSFSEQFWAKKEPEIIALCEELPWNEVSKRLYIPYDVVSRIAKKHGYSPHRRSPKKLGAIKADVIAYYKAGHNLVDTAKHFGTHWRQIRKLLEENNVEYYYHPLRILTAEQKEHICSLYLKGLSCADVSRAVGLSAYYVYSAIKEAGISRRSGPVPTKSIKR